MHDVAYQIVVTEPEFVKAEAVFREATAFGVLVSPPDEAELADTIRTSRARAAIVGVERYSGALYDALPAGGVISRFGVGHDGIDKARARAAGLLVTNTPGVLDQAVAEHVFALLLAVAKRLPAFAMEAGEGMWKPERTAEVSGKTLAVIGCGSIGCRVARMAHFGFGMRVVGCDVRDLDGATLREQFGIVRLSRSFAEAVDGAQYVSLHIPASAETRHFLSHERLTLLAADTVLINTARGPIIDEAALFEALSCGRLGAAALDVFEQEPYVPCDRARDLRRLPNVLMTPHVASNTTDACERMARLALRNVELVLSGRAEEARTVRAPGETAGQQ